MPQIRIKRKHFSALEEMIDAHEEWDGNYTGDVEDEATIAIRKIQRRLAREAVNFLREATGWEPKEPEK